MSLSSTIAVHDDSCCHFVQDGQSRTVRQFQFTDWPEHGLPSGGETFIEFIGQVHKTKEQFGHEGPITVHCRFVRCCCSSARRSLNALNVLVMMSSSH